MLSRCNACSRYFEREEPGRCPACRRGQLDPASPDPLLRLAAAWHRVAAQEARSNSRAGATGVDHGRHLDRPILAYDVISISIQASGVPEGSGFADSHLRYLRGENNNAPTRRHWDIADDVDERELRDAAEAVHRAWPADRPLNDRYDLDTLLEGEDGDAALKEAAQLHARATHRRAIRQALERKSRAHALYAEAYRAHASGEGRRPGREIDLGSHDTYSLSNAEARALRELVDAVLLPPAKS